MLKHVNKILAILVLSALTVTITACCGGCPFSDKENCCGSSACSAKQGCSSSGKCCGSSACSAKKGCSSGTCSASSECSSGVCGVTADVKIKHLNIADLSRIVDEKSATILDARSAKWDDGNRIPGAKSLPSSATEEEIKKIVPDKTQAIVTYCSNTKCPASKKLATKLKSMGYKNVSEYAPGIKGWMEAGKKVEKAK